VKWIACLLLAAGCSAHEVCSGTAGNCGIADLAASDDLRVPDAAVPADAALAHDDLHVPDAAVPEDAAELAHADLTSVDLTSVDLTSVDLTPVDLTPVDLTTVDLTPVDLRPVDLRPVLTNCTGYTNCLLDCPDDPNNPGYFQPECENFCAAHATATARQLYFQATFGCAAKAFCVGTCTSNEANGVTLPLSDACNACIANAYMTNASGVQTACQTDVAACNADLS
jgi:hypothetical protein